MYGLYFDYSDMYCSYTLTTSDGNQVVLDKNIFIVMNARIIYVAYYIMTHDSFRSCMVLTSLFMSIYNFKLL